MDTFLNEFGMRQAKAAGKALKDVTFHQAYTSDLERANKTCQIIVDENKSPAITSEQIIQDELIKERNFGEFENKLVSERQAMVKAANPNSENMNFFDFTPKTGESRETVRKRAREFLTTVVAKNVELDAESPSVLMVSHGGLIRELHIVIFNESGCDFPTATKPGDHKKIIPNTSWSRFILEICMDTLDIKTIRCEVLGNSDHLNGLE